MVSVTKKIIMCIVIIIIQAVFKGYFSIHEYLMTTHMKKFYLVCQNTDTADSPAGKFKNNTNSKTT